MRGSGLIRALCLVPLFLFSSCEGTSFRSSVPTYPVHAVIDTRLSAFVHFQPTMMGSYVTVNKNGYFLDGKYVQPVTVMDAWGYGGIVVYVSPTGYNAYDLACPYCAGRGLCQSCLIDGANAVCARCGEEYDLLSGVAVPLHGLSHETLRPLNLINSDGKLTVTQKQ